MSLDFVAIDFETANSFRGSACAVGLVRVTDGAVVDRQMRLIKPVTRDWNPKRSPLKLLFDPFNVSIHGLTHADVKDASPWHQAWPGILDYTAGLPLVAHYAAFDMGVIRDALVADGDDWPTLDYLCTVILSRVTYDIPSHSLPYVAQAAGVAFDEDRYHQADYDAELSARILIEIAHRHGASTITDVATAAGVRIGSITPDGWRGAAKVFHHLRGADFPVNPDADPGHPFWGRHICITGTLAIERRDALARIAQVGGLPMNSVTKATDVLVIGEQDGAKLRPGMTRSIKQEKAASLREQGQILELLTEQEFRRNLDETGSEGRRLQRPPGG